MSRLRMARIAASVNVQSQASGRGSTRCQWKSSRTQVTPLSLSRPAGASIEDGSG